MSVKQIRSYLFGLFILVAITSFYHYVPWFKTTTIVLSYLLVILIASVTWDLGVAVFMSIVATLAIDFYFLAPIGSFTISDPQDWVNVLSFLVVSLIGSKLATYARRQAQEATNQRKQIQRLYQFSETLLKSERGLELPNEIPHLLLESFCLHSAALYLADTAGVHRAGTMIPEMDLSALRAAFTANETAVDEKHEVCLAPVRLADLTIGSFAVGGAVLSKETLGAIATLMAIAIGRVRAIELLTQSTAARESERLKGVLLDAIAHDFKTPLTSIKAAATSLLEDLRFNKKQRGELLVIIDEECDRINRVIGESIAMARLDAGNVKLQLGRHTVDELVNAALAECGNIRNTRPIKTEISQPARSIQADLFWTTKVFDHLIRNADLYSTPGQPITIVTEDQNGFVLFHVADRGPGIEQSEIEHIFEKFYRGKAQRHRVPGTGMGLAVAKAIVEAHGGRLEAVSEPGHGSIFTFSLPAESAINQMELSHSSRPN